MRRVTLRRVLSALPSNGHLEVFQDADKSTDNVEPQHIPLSLLAAAASALQTTDIDTLAELNAIVSDATLADAATLATLDGQFVVETDDFTLGASHLGKVVFVNKATAVTVTLPDTLAVNYQTTIVQVGVGVPTVTPNTDTINGAGAGVAPSAQWEGLYLAQFADTEWVAIGA